MIIYNGMHSKNQTVTPAKHRCEVKGDKDAIQVHRPPALCKPRQIVTQDKPAAAVSTATITATSFIIKIISRVGYFSTLIQSPTETSSRHCTCSSEEAWSVNLVSS